MNRQASGPATFECPICGSQLQLETLDDLHDHVEQHLEAQ